MMVSSALLITVLGGHMIGSPAKVGPKEYRLTVVESYRSKSVSEFEETFNGSSSSTLTYTDSKWKVTGLLPISKADLVDLGERATISFNAGAINWTKDLSKQAGLNLSSSKIRITFDVPATQDVGFTILRRPGDPPPGPKPAEGTKIIIGTMQISWVPEGAEITIEGTKSTPLLAPSFSNQGDGPFEGEAKLSLQIGSFKMTGANLLVTGKSKSRSSGGGSRSLQESVVDLKVSQAVAAGPVRVVNPKQ